MPLLSRGVAAVVLFVCMGLNVAVSRGDENRAVVDKASPAVRGYSALRTHPFLPPDFDEAVLSSLWTVWPEPDRTQAEQADEATRRRLIFSYYGIMPDPEAAPAIKPLGYVVDASGTWTMNCLACHGGKVAGRVIPGLPNSHTALQTLTEDVRLVKLSQGKKLGHLDLATLQLPLSTTNGTTNAVMFGVVLGTYRNLDMTVDTNRKLPKLSHHDMDAPPFWNVRKKRSLYADGHSPKTPRPLMQFILLPRVTPEKLAEWEPHFTDLLAWIESLEPPTYPFEIKLDPRLKNVTLADVQEQFKLAMKLRDQTTKANDAVIQIRAIKEKLTKQPDSPANKKLKEQLSIIEENLYQIRNQSGQDPLNFPIKLNNRLAALWRSVETGDAKPTAGSYKVYDELSAELSTQLGELDKLVKVSKGIGM